MYKDGQRWCSSGSCTPGRKTCAEVLENLKKTFFADSWAGPDDLHPWQVNGKALEDRSVRLETKGDLFLTGKGGSISIFCPHHWSEVHVSTTQRLMCIW